MGGLTLFFRDDAFYFTDSASRQRITAQNGDMLRRGCVIYGLVLAFYTALTIFTRQPDVLKTMYFFFDAVHVLLCVVVFAHPIRRRQSYWLTQLLCCVLELSLLCFFSLEGVLAFPTEHALYVPIAILLVQLLFIHKAWYAFTVILVYTASFAVMSWLHKPPEAAENDLYIALATFLAANIGYVLIARLRFSEQHALKKLEELSRTDALTGLYNKSALESLCQHRMSAEHCAVVVFDLDNFKNVNDEYGHNVGDEVLRGVGHVLQNTFGPADIVGRFGGDEFVALMDGCADGPAVQKKTDAFRRQLAQLRFSAPELTVYCSAGAALKRGGDDFSAMFVRADQALYSAKRQGGDCACIEGPS